jgi:hypothetical protein
MARHSKGSQDLKRAVVPQKEEEENKEEEKEK